MAINLYPHQLTALREIDNGKIVKGGVGSGKSITSLAYFVAKEVKGEFKLNGKGDYKPPAEPKDLYIITTAKKRNSLEWEGELLNFGLASDPAISIGGIKATVDSWNNIDKYKEVKNAFFIFDEQRLVGSGAWVKAFLAIAASNRWIVLSATPGDNWLDYIPVFIANGFYKNRTEFTRRHVVYNHYRGFASVDHYVEERVLHNLRRSILVDMPFVRHTKRHLQQVPVDYDTVLADRIFKDRWNIYEDRPIENISELWYTYRKLVNGDVSRLAATMDIFEKHPRLIIFYNFTYELEILRTLCNTLGTTFAEYNGQKHEDLPEGDKWIYLVQYTAGAEGWNCITTNAILFYSLNYSYKILEQCQGRVDRINTPYVDLFYYILRSNSLIDRGITKAIATKKNFNERAFMPW